MINKDKKYIHIDIESSGLDFINSYPIEIAWLSEDGKSDEFLIKPHSKWKYWDYESEKIHGIKRKELFENGIDITEACLRLNNNLRGLTVFSDSVIYDSLWLGTLFRCTNIQAEFFIEQMPFIDRSGYDIPHRALADCKLYIDIMMKNGSFDT